MSLSAQLTVQADIRFLNLIGLFVSEISALGSVPQEQVYNLQLAADEASTNVITHSYHDDPTQNFSLTCRIDENVFTIEIIDQGEPFNLEQIPEPDVHSNLEARKIGGLGLYFIKMVMDSVQQFHEENGINRLVMMKKIGTADDVKAKF
jgi:serine/threonine-protein kinase RsbW